MSATPFWRRYLKISTPPRTERAAGARFWGPDPAADVNDEFAFHVQTRIDELVAEGRSPRDARDEALRGFGDIEQVKRICTALAQGQVRAVRRTEWWFGWRQDVRYALRQLRASPVLTAVLVATLGIGIGATVSVFSVLHAVLLRPLPFADSDRIVNVYETWRAFSRGSASVGHFHDWSEQATVFEDIAAMQRATYNLSDGEPERVSGARLTPGYFRVADIAPTLGRYFTERDLESGPGLVVLSHGLWQRRFAGDRSIVGRTIRLNGEPHTVVGVAAAGYNMTPAAPQLFTPLVFTPQQRANYGNHSFSVVAKLKPGVTQETAQADLERVTRGIAERQPRSMEGRSVNVQMSTSVLLGGNFRTGLYVMLSAVLFVLLIGCVNIANLLLARATIRRREIAIRSAIGGGRWRIVRQLLTESLVLALAGGAVGMALAYIGVGLFVKFGWANVPRLQEASLQTEVLLFALGTTVLTGLIFGLAPAVRAARENTLTTLREGGRTSLLASHDRVRTSLVVAEVALAVVLLVGAGLFIRSAWKLQNVPLGFETADSITARVALPPDRYEDNATVADAYRRMLEGVRTAPGIEYAGASTAIPLLGGGPDSGTRIEGKPFTPGNMISPRIRLVTDQYIEAIGIPVLRGRTLQPGDVAPGAQPVVVINERLAAAGWPGEDPIGKRLSTWTAVAEVPEWREVIGVVGDVRSLGPDTPPSPELFIPYTQPPPLAWVTFQRSMALVARTASAPAAQAGSLRRAVRSVDSSLPLFEVQTMEEAVDAWGAGTRFSTSLLLLLAGIGLLLAAIGIYGVIAYFVTQRTPEIGLRLALGASRGNVLMLVLRHGIALAATGIAIGVLAAFGLTRVLRTLLFEVTPTDMPSYAIGSAGLFTIALLACLIPALRAVRVDPVRSLTET
jgi:putative ABC transport system permease protein